MDDSEPLIYLLNGQNSAVAFSLICRDFHIRLGLVLNAWNEWRSPLLLARFFNRCKSTRREYGATAWIKGLTRL